MKRKRVPCTVRSDLLSRPLRLAVAADLHNAPYGDVRDELLQSDAVLLPGDLVDRHSRTYEWAERFLRDVPERVPVFCSVGNHERRCEYREEWMRKVRDSRMILLDNESVPFEGIRIGGLSSAEDGRADTDFLDRFEREEGFRLLLCHHPEMYRDYVSGREIDFTVCGHAHGGQVQILGRGLYAPGQGVFPKLTHGLHDGGKMLVSRGMTNATWAPRINNPTELIILRLEPEGEEGKE